MTSRQAASVDVELQLERDGMQNFVGGIRWDCEIDGLDVRRRRRLRMLHSHGLAAAHFAGHLDDALAVADGVNQRFQDRAAIARPEKKLRCWGVIFNVPGSLSKVSL